MKVVPEKCVATSNGGMRGERENLRYFGKNLLESFSSVKNLFSSLYIIIHDMRKDGNRNACDS